MDREIIENFNSSDPITEGEEYLLNKFKTSPRFKGWTIFEQPHINSMKPDFILLHSDKGIIIIEVKDWNLSSETYENGGYIWGGEWRKD
ncbi:TPA: NERD domain-containing protein [Clostridium perfringens]